MSHPQALLFPRNKSVHDMQVTCMDCVDCGATCGVDVCRFGRCVVSRDFGLCDLVILSHDFVSSVSRGAHDVFRRSCTRMPCDRHIMI